MKRVYTLYRVSTLGQVEKDDIPMQKTACHDFVARNHDWKIEKEFSEKGVSGFKKSAKERDAIIEMQQAAVEKEFDVLLVFMFDRIGRRDDETPFVVEWFVQNGIEVWSVTEGQQKFENHVDKLLNYIRYWQAAGESIKTSIRVKSRMGQLVLEGQFKGGVAPFGYSLEKLGRINKKGHEVHDLVVDEIEASIVRIVFDRYANAGMGTQRVATFLAKEGIFNRKGERFVSGTIRNMLKNPMYRGILRSGDSVSKPFEHLRIINDDIFFRTQEFLKQRSLSNASDRFIPRRYSTNCLLTGNIYCANCGARLVTSTAGKRRIRKDGTLYDGRYWRYLCYNHMRHKGKCNGQYGYSAKMIDEAVGKTVRELLHQAKAVPLSSIMGKYQDDKGNETRAKFILAEKAMRKAADNIETIKAEMVKEIRGESNYSAKLLNEMMVKAEKDLCDVQASVELHKEALSCKGQLESEFKVQHDKLVAWADIFDDCDFDVKKMIVCQLVSRVLVGSEYKISVELTLTMNQYMELAGQDVKAAA